MIAVGIDISKAKSTVAVIDSDGTVLASPFTMAHTQPEMEAFVTYLKGLGEPTTILMEYTGHYHYPVLKKLQGEGFPVCIVNPYQMKKYGDVEIHKAKTDKKDALRIAAYPCRAGGNGNHAARPVLNAEYWRNCTGAVCGCGDRNGDDQWKLDPL